MQYLVEFEPCSFEFWAGARGRMNDATDEQREAVYERIESTFDYCNGDLPTETDINDLVWFECDDIFFPEDE